MHLKLAILFVAITLLNLVASEWTLKIPFNEVVRIDFYAYPSDRSTVVFHTQWTWHPADDRPNIIHDGTHVTWNGQTQGVRGDGPYWLTRTRSRLFGLVDQAIPEIGFDLAVGAQYVRPNLHVTDPVYPRWRWTANGDVNYREITFTEPQSATIN
ncbi:hypothetical protein PtrV1_12268 [Pyrenophora tritici-repentis]|nr:hypothetical protein PtrV1_12268 [Pyrenophora tritici-repentis]